MKVGSLFSGVGGFDYGLERAGMRVVWQSEIEPYCCEVLKKHWPEVPNLGDIFSIKDPPAVDLICGGFPCQPFSVAGKRQGKADDRYLWPEMLRVITEVKPRWVIGENVAGFITMELHNALLDLEGAGYEVYPFVVPACAVGSPQRRDRIWILAYSEKQFGNGGNHNRRSRSKQIPQPGNRSEKSRPVGDWWAREPRMDRVAHGLPPEVDRLKALGNAIVPQIAEEIGRMILEITQDK